MAGPATYARDADLASTAREQLDVAARAAATVESAQRQLLTALLELWPTSAWRAAGATSAKRWLLAYTHCSEQEAHRLERLAGLCHRHPALATAVTSGGLSLARAHRLGAAAIEERAPWLADSLVHLLELNDRGGTAEAWAEVLRHWVDLVDQERTVRQVPRHGLTMTQRLFGGGEIHADLSPSAFLNVAAAVDAWTDDPDPTGAPHQRTLSERRADGLDDLARASLDPDGTRWGVTGDDEDDSSWEAAAAIAARDRHCVFPSCTRPPRMCDVHHLDHRADGGPTRTANGALLCRHHHRLLHEHGWTLSVIDGRWVATDRHGTTWTGRPRAPDRTTAKTPG